MDGDDPLVETEVRLRVVASAAGHIALSASATPAARTHLTWSQSPSLVSDGYECQVFAKFDTAQSFELATLATTEVESDGTPDGGQLAATGASVDVALAAGVAAVAVGVIAFALAHRRVRTRDSVR